ncbi:response regulator [Aurantiacibacter suaedae]|uniref:response regulator n=1 Tax=Aurantiacibacter suaedae TaxID=2545755 RepID=UPI001F501DD3|nr:response regulator [Aurantiacibacter suaedae]
MPSTSTDTSADERPKPVRGLAHVLLVEDDAILAMALEDALMRAGAGKVTICASVEQTMRELDSEQRPDAIVLDVHLADRDDGWALAELVTMLGPRPPRIAFSTGSPESIPANVAALGPVFVKPYDPDDLAAALSEGPKSGLFTLLRRNGR